MRLLYIYNSRNSKDLIVRIKENPAAEIYNSRNSKDLIVKISQAERHAISTTVEIQKT